MKFEDLREWQKKAFSAFSYNKFKGIIKAATGSGKTKLGIYFIDFFKSDIVFGDETFLITVPTETLLTQWHRKIEEETDLPVGRIGAGFNEEQKVTVAIINSVRRKKLNYKNLILDECHHYLSEVNQNLFELNKFQRIMGLSATPERSDLKDYAKYGLDIIYEYSVNDAISNNDLCKYEIKYICVDMNKSEKERYEKYDKVFNQLFPMFDYKLDAIYKPPWSVDKARIRKAIHERNDIVAKAENKISSIINLVKNNKDKKIMIFAQFIYSMNEIHRKLKGENVESVIYSTNKKIREKSVNDFRNNIANVMISARALDEGIDIPDCDMAIVMAGFKGERQIKQRLGRILRKKEKIAIIYLLYCSESKDERWLKDIKKYI